MRRHRKMELKREIIDTSDFVGQTVGLFFGDESTKIGSGRRFVTIKRVGYKWVELTIAANGRGTKLKRAVWDEITAAKNNRSVFA